MAEMDDIALTAPGIAAIHLTIMFIALLIINTFHCNLRVTGTSSSLIKDFFFFCHDEHQVIKMST